MSFEPDFALLEAREPLPRFVVLHLPRATPRALVVHAPAFGDEMNKARRMVAAQARALADAGAAVLLVDPLGTGDSPGEHGDARWDVWVRDVVLAVDWLRHEFRRRWPDFAEPPVVLWGLRAGALLACAAARQVSVPCSLLFWQPALQGRAVLQQFLRLLSAADMVAGRAPAQGGRTAAGAREALARGDAREVGGYVLDPQLASGLERAVLAPPSLASRMVALELSTRTDARLSPALQTAVADWLRHGAQARAEVVPGPAFWQTTEIEDAPALIKATLQAVGDLLGAGPLVSEAQDGIRPPVPQEAA